MIIVRVLYGLNSARALFMAHLANTLQIIEFKPKFANRNVWMRKNFFPLLQEINDSAGSGRGDDTTVLRPAPNTSNYALTSGTIYYE